MGKKVPRSEAASADVRKKAKNFVNFPSVADMGASVMGSSQNVVKSHKDQDIHCTCLTYCKKGSVYSSVFDDGELVLVLMECGARPSPLYNMKLLVQTYGQTEKNEKDPPPQSLDEVASRYAAEYTFVWKKTVDADDVSFKRNASGWYVSASKLKDFFMYFDDLMRYRFGLESGEFQRVEERNIMVHIPVESALEMKLDKEVDELQCSFTVEKAQHQQELVASVFDVPPPTYPSRITILSLELVSETKLHAVFGGNTKPFQAEFAGRGIAGRSFKSCPEDTYSEYFRTIEFMDCAEPEDCAELLKVVFEKVLHGSPVIIRIKDSKIDPAKAKKVVELLRVMQNVKVDL